jgi:hypothetical protein
MPKDKHANVDPAVLDAYRRMLAGVPEAELKGAECPYTSLNGNMYSNISRANVIGLRLGPADRAAFLAKFNGTLFESIPGFIQKEYVAVPAALLDDTPTLQDYFQRSHAYAGTLRPKATQQR